MMVLLGLGLWQLQRLQWKLTLIGHIAERVHAPPVPIESVLVPGVGGRDDLEYIHVSASGRYRSELERYLYATGDGDWGWDVFTPLELADGRAILVNRGFVPRQLLDRSSRAPGLADGAVTVTGLIRRAPGAPPWWNPAGDPAKGQWYWPEIGAIAASMYPRGGQPVIGYYLDSDPIAASAPPTGGTTNLDLPNRHLEYALTWFGLAAALGVIYAIFVFRRAPGPRG